MTDKILQQVLDRSDCCNPALRVNATFGGTVDVDSIVTWRLFDKLASGEQIPFLLVFDGATSTSYELDGVTPYVITGTVQADVSRENAGYEDVAVDDSTEVTLASIPTGANAAELVYKGTGYLYFNETTGGPTPLADGSVGYRVSPDELFELQGADELANFEAISATAGSGNIEVRYKFDYLTNS